MKALILFLFLLPLQLLAQENVLLQECGKKDLSACEKLGALYLSQSDWEKTYIVGEALCEKEMGTGCMFAGSALFAQGKIKEGKPFLNKACDLFEPLSCRSLGRLMDKTGEKALANMYFKRSCFYGERDICSQVKDSMPFFSPAAIALATKIKQDCVDTQSEICHANLFTIKGCALPLNRLDCELLSGHLSMFFRAKLIQSQAKIALLSLHEDQSSLKADPLRNSYSYDLSTVHKNRSHPQINYQYIVGFMKACAKKYVKGRFAKTHSKEVWPHSFKHIGPRTTANILSYFAKGKSEDCYDPNSGYEAFAVGILDPLHLSHLDVWRIDQDKRIENISDGLPLL